jgi:hypothetical protein
LVWFDVIWCKNENKKLTVESTPGILAKKLRWRRKEGGRDWLGGSLSGHHPPSYSPTVTLQGNQPCGKYAALTTRVPYSVDLNVGFLKPGLA